jgi:hypothetical protein
MKLILSSLLLLLSVQSMATGSVYCESKNAEFVLEGTVGRVTGDPLVGETYLKIEEEVNSIPRDQVVNYWSDEQEIKMLILDEQMNEVVLKLEVKKNIFGNFKGKAKTANKTYKVNCPFF